MLMKFFSTTGTQKANPKVIGGLDTFRAFAFLAVFLYHLRILPCGYLGVQAFFVLSGFLITRILVEMKINLTGKKFFSHFYGRRALRIFPVYYFYLLVGGVTTYFLMHDFGYANDEILITFWKELPILATYTSDFSHILSTYTPSPLAGHFFSLAIEEQFYLIWPFIIYSVSREKLKITLLLFIVTGPLIRLIEAIVSYYQVIPMVSGSVSNVVYALPFSYFDAFAIGGFFSVFRPKVEKKYLWLLIVLVPMLGMLMEKIAFGVVAWRALGYPAYMFGSLRCVWGYSLWSLLFCVAIQLVSEGNLFPTLFNNSFLRYLGKISYGLYVFHVPVLLVTEHFGQKMPRILMGGLALLLTIITSTISFELMEKYFLRLKEKLVPKV
jgi:peptidoglycan/LPS O-acetylase OafA/YrhL